MQVQETVGCDQSHFADLEKDNLVKLSTQGIEVTDLGRFFIRNVAAALDPMFKSGANMYSKSV
jgi:oxygen-independent coproporphyrinogen-3 oxidase